MESSAQLLLPWLERHSHLHACLSISGGCNQIIPPVLLSDVAVSRHVRMQASHGNTPMSLLLTVVTNMLGVVTVPYLLKFLVGTSSVRQEKLTST